MKNIKKFFLFLCCSLLLLSLVPISASALIFSDGDFGFELNTYAKYATLVEYTGTDSVVDIPSEYSGYPVKKISQKAFMNNSSVEEVRFPTTISSLDTRSFMNCTSLKKIDLPAYISELGQELFANCSSLEHVGIYTETVPVRCFAGCTALSEIYFSDYVNSIRDYAFQDCSSLTDLSLSSSITSLGSHSFEGTGIQELLIPDGITNIPDYAFANCSNLEKVTINQNVTYISSVAFKNDSLLIIYCYYDSYAYNYAIVNNNSYALLDGVKLGDVNNDNAVNVNDATYIQGYLAELENLDGIYLHAADANEDGEVDISDATAIQMYSAEYQSGHPIGQVMTK